MSSPLAQVVPGSYVPTVDPNTGTLPDKVVAGIEQSVGDVFGKRGDAPAELDAAGAVGRFNPEMATYNWKPSNTLRFRTALGKAIVGVDRCNIVAAGESTTAGRGLTNTELAYPAFLRKALAARGLPMTGNGPSLPGRGDPLVVDAFTTMDANWSSGPQYLYALSSTAGAKMTVTGTGTTLSIIMSQYGGGSFTYAIDGKAAVAVNASGAQALQTITVTGLAAGAHTVVITNTSNTVYIYSVEFALPTGISVTNGGASGSTVSAFWAPGTFYNDLGAVLQQNPHLVLFGMQINDLAAGTTPAAYFAALRGVLSTIQAVSDVVVCTSNAAVGNWAPSQWSAFNAVQYQLADQLNIPLIDVSYRMPSYAVNNAAGIMLDGYHPNGSYYAERGNHHARALLTV